MKASVDTKLRWMGVALTVVVLAWPSFGAENDATKDKAAVTTGVPASKDDVNQLRAKLTEQQQEIASQRDQLAAQHEEIEQLRRSLEAQQRVLSGLSSLHFDAGASQPHGEPVTFSETESMPSVTPAVWKSSVEPGGTGTQEQTLEQKSPEQITEMAPLQLKIGDTYITPVGFMDFTSVFRTSNVGSGIGTNFGSIPLNTSPQGKLSEWMLSPQNSRLGLRLDSDVHDYRVLGYYESDFLGNQPTNVLVSTNSFTYRLRLFYADVRKSKWEVLGGQAWSLITPGRPNLSRDLISPLPENLFFTENVDTDYQIGLPWARIPTFRFGYRLSEPVAWAIALENPQQYAGGSSGGGSITLPVALRGPLGGFTGGPIAGQLNDGTTNFTVPNPYPDVVSKFVYDPFGSHDLHFELAGMLRGFKLVDPLNNRTSTATGWAGAFNSNVELWTGGKLRLIDSLFYGPGAGRYLFGQGPDVIVRADGTLGLVTAFGAVGGFESKVGKRWLLYDYYGDDYFRKEFALDADGKTPIGYGFAGSPASNNRAIQEITTGFKYAFWQHDPVGKLQVFVQYSYLFRKPWSASPGQEWNSNMIFVNLRYSLPGRPPTLE